MPAIGKRTDSVKKKPFYYVLNLGFLPYDIIVCQGATMVDTKKYLEKTYGLDIVSEKEIWSDRKQGKTLHLDTHQTIIWLKHPPDVAEGTLAHEAVHAMNMILATCGIGTSQDNDEVLAYGVEYVVRETLEAYGKSRH